MICPLVIIVNILARIGNDLCLHLSTYHLPIKNQPSRQGERSDNNGNRHSSHVLQQEKSPARNGRLQPDPSKQGTDGNKLLFDIQDQGVDLGLLWSIHCLGSLSEGPPAQFQFLRIMARLGILATRHSIGLSGAASALGIEPDLPESTGGLFDNDPRSNSAFPFQG